MVQLLKRIYLAFQHFFFGLTLDRPDIDDLNCNLLLGFVVGAPVNHGAEAPADDVLEAVGVVLDLLTKLIMSVGILSVVHSNSI